jgi:hypothetical protein
LPSVKRRASAVGSGLLLALIQASGCVAPFKVR